MGKIAGASAGIALVLIVVVVTGALVLAVSGGRSSHIPLLLDVVPGAGSSLVEMTLDVPGLLVWWVGLSVLLSALAYMTVARNPTRAD